eukprot:CAMPEP_0203812976 /NCGR_PEP_ID=MMETSP0115-20131106/4460_1 /ASSEMBLY_ACC=CAM_ASM_000227 /TAXON_ID=33651 /ORGANISM="Bicosoecid sp, Strain ms1" /LENGTH=192 /DNA_ID=CAMNT_0050721833 /DNA_START=362 /DNA_END=937 /DNA_ORIENTATION=-
MAAARAKAKAAPLVPAKLTPEQLSEFHDCFNFFDDDHDGRINSVQMAQVIRSLGFNPTEAELDELRVVVDRKHRGSISFTAFTQLMSGRVVPAAPKPADASALIKKAFQTFSDRCRHGDDGTVLIEDLRMLLMEYGDGFTPAMMEEMLAIAEVDDEYGDVDYIDLVDKVIGRGHKAKKAPVRVPPPPAAGGA